MIKYLVKGVVYDILLVFPLAIYTRYSTRLLHVNLESIYDLLPWLVIPMSLVVGPYVFITQMFPCQCPS